MSRGAATTAYTREQAEVYDDQRFKDPIGRRIHAAELGNLLKALRLVTRDEARILEVGCGTGRLLMEGRRAGYRVDGMDASPDMLDMLRDKEIGNFPDLDLQLGEAGKLPHDDASFDLVYCIRLLNQTESPEYALGVVSEMFRVAKPGGFILAEFVNAHRPRWGDNKRDTTRLSPSDVADRGAAEGGRVVRHLGAFFLGMQAYHRAPRALLGLVAVVDRTLSRCFPRLCARSYVLFQKPAADAANSAGSA